MASRRKQRRDPDLGQPCAVAGHTHVLLQTQGLLLPLGKLSL